MAHTNINLKQATGIPIKIGPTLVLAINPNSGPSDGGTPVTITGKNFRPGAQATIGGTPCTSEVVLSKTSMTAVTGAHPSGTEGSDVVVTNPLGGDGHGLSGTGVGLFSYIYPPPSVDSILPNSGPALGGTPVTISGDDFVVGATVSIGGVPCTSVVVVNENTITAVTGAHVAEANLDVVVTNPDLQVGVGVGLFEYT